VSLPASLAESSLVEDAPAKVNLTLRVLGRRADGYHELESLVAFATGGEACSDRLCFAPGDKLTLAVSGPRATQAGESAENLVLKAARALKARIPSATLGAFHLEKSLPVAAGLGGGSADAGAALRLIARANGIAGDDPRLHEAARATGADVPVCLDPRPRLMRGIGEKLSGPLALPPLPAVLLNPGVVLATKLVFAGWAPAAEAPVAFDLGVLAQGASHDRFLQYLATEPNDLEDAAITLAPAIADVLAALRALPGCRLARMSGSGATCFGLFASAAAASAAAEEIQTKHSGWWIAETALG
jgi:4-diphosphocytidyl-2-C-methyl-D-erythritol kinase